MRVLSLFSGCGGMDLGFEGGFTCLKKSINQVIHPEWVKEELVDWVRLKKTQFHTVFANDIRPDAKRVWCDYFTRYVSDPESVYHLDSIVDLVKAARENSMSFPADVDVVTGGFPCQDFSVSGKRLGFQSQKSHRGTLLDIDEPSVESRGQLYIWMREVVSLTLPKIFIAENVKGLTNLQDVKQIIEKDFSEAGGGGYLVVPAKVLYAPDYGVPQSRERVIFFGFNKSFLKPDAKKALAMDEIPEWYDPYPPKTHEKAGNGMPYVTCSDAFIGLDEPMLSNDLSQQKYSQAKFMGAHCQGQTEVRLDAVGPTIRSEHHGNIEYRRLSLEHGGRHNAEIEMGLQERRLTVRECARLQTFPDDYSFILPKQNGLSAVSASDAYKLIGNAVPCLLAYHIAMNLQEKWERYFIEYDAR